MSQPCNGNLLLCSDSYKVTHWKQYPPSTELVFAYFESRGGEFQETLFYGLQYILKKWLCGQVVTKEKIQEAKEILDAHLGPGCFNQEGWEYILKEHGGKLPLEIKAVPEGSTIPTRNVLFTVVNTDPKCFWLTTYVETLLVEVWYPMTVATISKEMKMIIGKYLLETADNLNGLPTMLHDFGFRGASSVESAALGGSAHLVNFRGTDNLASLILARDYYHAKEIAGVSIPASEHSTITAWKKTGEKDAFKNMLTQFPNGPVACVSDSYNIWNACEKYWGEDLKEMVEDRGKRGVGPLVVRPDSGDPPTVVCKVLDILGSKFGTSVNDKGYKVLPPYLRVIQGDGISYKSLEGILVKMKEENWSADNVSFGCGGGLLQKLNRDTQRCAYKCSYVIVDGVGVEVFKDPITDKKKTSKKGLLMLEHDNGQYVTKSIGTGDPAKNVLVTVFKNGQLLCDYSFDDIRRRAERDLF
uniref:Nicotinamide phosphoribosyltransferase n=1 Tax=Halisarca dujardinii TaxID=2583056 RepID=A0A6C0PND2_HALDU|nr:nicotinamide phosphoribosyltransferase-like protein [Halisarca dujardinii]